LSQKQGFELKQNNNRAVLLFHGMTGSPFEMRQYGKFLNRAGFDVFCPCLPGHGGSMSELKKTTWQDWSKFSLEEFDKLKKNYNEVFAAGLCMGGVLAINIAEKRDNLAGIISLSTTLYLDGWKMPWYKFLFPIGLNTLLKFFYDFPEEDPYGIKNETVRRKISKLLKTNETAFDCFPLVCALELLRLSKHVIKNLKKVKTPILLIHSEEDDLTSTKSAEVVYKNISSEKKEYIKLKNSYHLILMDNDKDFVFEKSLEFLNNLSKHNKIAFPEDEKIISY